MLKIETRVSPDLLVFEVEGPLSGQGIAEAIQKNHHLLVGRGCLWDMRKADFSALQQTEFPKISATARQVTQVGRSGKIAYLVADSRAYLTMCKYMNHSVQSRVPMEYAVFQDMAEAKKWLFEDPVAGSTGVAPN